jgi:hypothetical protein
LEIKTNSLGDGHVEVAVATTSVAELMSDMGRYEEVVKLCRRVLEIYRQQSNTKMYIRPVITVQVGLLLVKFRPNHRSIGSWVMVAWVSSMWEPCSVVGVGGCSFPGTPQQ